MRNTTARLKPGLRSGYVITCFGPVLAHSGIVITFARTRTLLVLLPCAVLLGLSVNISVGSFKKYL